MKIISQNEQMGMMHSKPEPAAKLNHLLAKASLYPMNLSATVCICEFIGKLTVIVGKSGSGKTSLLAAILKEMRLVSGELIWNK